MLDKIKRLFHREKLYFGALENPEDSRDYVLSVSLDEAILPRKVDISDKIVWIKSQGQEGTCVGQAGSSFKEWFSGIKLSARYLYYRGRQISGYIPNPGKEHSGGSVPRDVMKALVQYGVCKEEMWPYKEWDTSHPTEGLDLDAKYHKFSSYSSALNIDIMRSHLATTGTPIMISVPIYDNGYQWYRSVVAKNNNTVTVGSKVTSGHGILVVGYDDDRQAFKILNSWGSGWGEGGFAWLPYTYPIKTSYTAIEMPSDYLFELVKQSDYPTLKPGETATLELTLKNVGRGDWNKGSIKIGTSNPKDRPSLFYNSDWIGINRACELKEKVNPGNIYKFEISITVPKNAKKGDVYREYFCPVVDGLTWLKDLGIYWDITIG